MKIINHYGDEVLSISQLSLIGRQAEMVEERTISPFGWTPIPPSPQIAQHSLFQTQFTDPDKLDLLLARLRSIAGEQNVGSAKLANSHREDACNFAPFRPELKDSAVENKHPQRPALRMLRPPQTVRGVDDE